MINKTKLNLISVVALALTNLATPANAKQCTLQDKLGGSKCTIKPEITLSSTGLYGVDFIQDKKGGLVPQYFEFQNGTITCIAYSDNGNVRYGTIQSGKNGTTISKFNLAKPFNFCTQR